jgi:flap endonuclease-1
MGIKNLNRFIRDICPYVFEEIEISEYRFQRVAIDISLYMNKYKAVAGENWLTAFVNLIACLRRNEIHCVFIFDGKPPDEKQDERARRRETRQKMEETLYNLEDALDDYHKTGEVAECLAELYNRRRSPTHKRLLKNDKVTINMEWIENKIRQKRSQLYSIESDDYEKVKELFRVLDVPYYTAPYEAEKMCSKLCIEEKVCAVLSEDTDVLAYGTPIFLSKIDTSKDTCVRVNHEALLSALSITKEQFLDLCIMCGTDYNTNIPKVGSKTAYKKILEHGNIENIGKVGRVDISILKHEVVRKLFIEFGEKTTEEIPYCGRPNFEKLESFMRVNNIRLSIERLKRDFTENIVVFEDSDGE